MLPVRTWNRYFLFNAYLTDDMLKEIIPMVGHRAKSRANLEEWRNVIALANDQK